MVRLWNSTSVMSAKTISFWLNKMQTPVITKCFSPDKLERICIASSLSAGLPIIFLFSTTIVSAESMGTASPSDNFILRALFLAMWMATSVWVKWRGAV